MIAVAYDFFENCILLQIITITDHDNPRSGIVKYVLKRISFGSKDCTKELKLECTNFLGQTS